RTTFFNRKLALATMGAIVFVAVLFFVRARTAGIPNVLPLPNPNGYDDFLNAAKAIEGFPSEVPTDDPDALRAFVQKNQRALELVRVGLSRDCVVSIEVSTNAFGMEFILS